MKFTAPPYPNSLRPYRSPSRRGLTFIELLLATAIMSLLIATLGAMASAVYKSSEFSEGYGLASQHARVVMNRINRTVREATANDDFPGVLVISETVGSWDFPDTLVVWSPDGAAADPTGLPLMNEIVVFCHNRDTPSELLELTDPGDTSQVPSPDDTTAWLTALETLRASNSRNEVVLTDLLRVSPVPSTPDNVSGSRRGNVRFIRRLSPTDSQWNEYQSSDIDWEDLSWPQGIYGSHTGLRQVWIRYELQLDSEANLVANDQDAMTAIPFFGSATLYYQLEATP